MTAYYQEIDRESLVQHSFWVLIKAIKLIYTEWRRKLLM